MYSFEEDKLIKEINERKPKRILLQLPEGLKKESIRLSKLIQDKCKTEVIVSGEPVWGACDIAVSEAKSLNADLIILYGHAQFIKIDYPIIYLEARYNKDITNLIKESLKYLKSYKKIALVSSVQHIHQLPQIKNFLEKENKEVIIPEKKGFSFYDGQVLGCEYNLLKPISKDVDSILIIGNNFHALGAALSVKNPVILIDPYNEEVKSMEELKNKVIKQRAAVLAKAKEAKKFGIIIGLKPGQKFGSFEYITDKLKKIEKEYVLISMNEVTNDKLINLYDVDAFVELACPRIAIEDVAKFDKPLLTAREFAVLVGDISWEDLLEKGFL